MILLTKHLITNFPQVGDLVVVNGDKDYTVVPQEVGGKAQAGIHHIEPVGVKTAHGFGVTFGGLLGHFLIPRQRVGKIVLIDEIIAGVVGRIDIDHLHLAVIGGLQEFENLQIVALYVKVLRGVKVHAFFGAGAQCAGGTLLRQPQTFRLSFPLKLVFFKIIIDILPAERQELVNIQFPLRKAFGKNRFQLVHVRLFYIH